ncbi:uncharacterized protein N0V89_008739 [Didymosphaeria variabile]|uniref:Uncharacterized protein n=1 Tax=Didymosphaeria variabile TaxID=1932322 RepID=A0A9W8XGT0_9PLEO|nr:uncharacterized protein N0V89_008739 [Didymosphaeria variabile]KAJ4350118.1 hypothetical protein N0V89_008739 [Didymosphaeria variabile]
MPPGFYYGDWYVSYSSNKKYMALDNLIWSLSPTLPTCGLASNSTPAECPLGTYPGQLADLSTWTLNGTHKLYSAFGYDTPRRINNASLGRGWVDTWDTVGNGALSYFVNGWQILAWGFDGNSNGWMLNYEIAVLADDTPACLDILSRVAEGPDRGTVARILRAVERLGNEELKVLKGEVRRMRVDGARKGLDPFVCGPDCTNNTDVGNAGNI